MNANSSTTSQQLKLCESVLSNAGIESARLDTLVLLEDVTNKTRAHLLAHPELELTTEQQKQLDDMIRRRTAHEPLAYIRGKAEFYGREFSVNEHVLVPRPESESMIDILGRYGYIPLIIDVGTGSGALAISAALARPDSKVIAVDIDEHCLKVAKQNAKRLGADIETRHGDLLRGINLDDYPGPIAILANLPYVPDAYEINQAARHEPKLALFGGPDGLDPYRVMFDQLDQYDDHEIIVLTESLESQHENLAGIAKDHGFLPGTSDVLIQSFTRIPV